MRLQRRYKWIITCIIISPFQRLEYGVKPDTNLQQQEVVQLLNKWLLPMYFEFMWAIAKLQDLMALRLDAREVRKALAVKLVYQGYLYDEIQTILHVSRGSQLKTYLKQG